MTKKMHVRHGGNKTDSAWRPHSLVRNWLVFLAWHCKDIQNARSSSIITAHLCLINLMCWTSTYWAYPCSGIAFMQFLPRNAEAPSLSGACKADDGLDVFHECSVLGV